MLLKNKSALLFRGSATAAAVACLLLLLACGDETTEVVTQSGQNYIEVVDEESDLPECAKDNEGEQVLVKGENIARTCVDGEWTAAFVPSKDTVYQKNKDISCSTKKLDNKQGVKIICDGDSVGVLFNGEEGAQGDKGDRGVDGAGCSLERLDSVTVSLFCGGDSIMIDLKHSSDTAKIVPTAEIDSEKIPTALDSLDVFVQVGSAFSYAEARIYGLGDGYSLRRSGGFYTNDASVSKEYYKFHGIELPSQYAVLEVVGNYTNVFVKAQRYPPSISLHALVDLTGRTSANVNLLTEMEYDRVEYLVMHEGMTASQAKKQAQSEVFEEFYIDAKDFGASEALDMWGNSDADLALLAVTVIVDLLSSGLMSRDPELDSFSSSFASAIKTTGKWKGNSAEQIKAELADQLLELGMPEIRKNVEWVHHGKVGNFEKYIENFIEYVYGMEPCGDGSESEQRVVNNEKSANHGKVFRCHVGYLSEESKNTFGNPEIDYGWMVDLRDRHAYRTVKIGAQTWMAENLNYEYKIRDYIVYGNGCGADSCEIYGRYYTYAAAMDSAAVFSKNGAGCGMQVDCAPINPVPGVCPEGWHLPDTTEFRSLISAFGDSLTAAKALKSLQLWADNKDGGSGNGKDNVGFDALPSGFAVFQKENLEIDSISNKDTSASFMSSVALKNDVNRNVYLLRLSTRENFAHVISGGGRPFGQSVRCIKD